MANTEGPGPLQSQEREKIVRLLSAATFIVFFQAYMVAPLIPRLSAALGASAQRVGLIVPAYLVPYGVAILCYGVLSDRVGRRRLIVGSLAAFVALTALTPLARSADALLVFRLLTGLGASAVVPLSLVLIGVLFPYAERGRPLGWLFGAMAGGMAFGSTIGPLLEPMIGWRGVFLLVAMVGGALLGLLWPVRRLLGEPPANPMALRAAMRGFRALMANRRGARTYAFVFSNAAFHSGVYTWLGLYLTERFHLAEAEIGLALLGYGVPGLLLGPAIGRAADRLGRRWLIPLGLAIAGLSAGTLALRVPVLPAAALITLLSLGYDMTQPLLAGIVTSLDPARAGQAMGLNVFCLFVGFGAGSALFGALLPRGIGAALATFAAAELALAVMSVPLFGSERRPVTSRDPQDAPPAGQA